MEDKISKMRDIFRYTGRKEDIGKRIQELRKAKKMTQRQLAGRISDIVPTDKDKGFGQPTISGWERGEQLPPLPKLIALSEIFQCDIAYLLCDYDKEKKDVSDIAEMTGLSTAAVKAIVDDRYGRKETRIEALNLLLTGEVFERMLGQLLALQEKAEEIYQLKMYESEQTEQHGEKYYDAALWKAKREAANDMRLIVADLNQEFVHLIDEIKRKAEEEVRKYG